MIVVAGEALVDLVVDPADPAHPTAYPGGSPANVAVTLARLETPVAFVARSSRDAFGRLVRDHLERNGVDLRHVVAADEPAGLAVVSVGGDGAARYSFHVAGAADWAWSDGELPTELPAQAAAIHTGSLALAIEPGASALGKWAAGRPSSVALSVDPNVRPDLVGLREGYRERLESWVRASDILKISAEDLAWVYPGADPLAVAAGWANQEDAPALLVVTMGGDGAAAWRGDHEVRLPSPPVDVVDTVGAGDAFSGSLLDWLRRHHRLRPDALRRLSTQEVEAALRFAARVAAITCGRRGADPPHRRDLGPA